MSNKYVISAVEYDYSLEDSDEIVYWSNTDGWGSLSTATVFSELEQSSFSLPMGHEVKWVILPTIFSYSEYNVIKNALFALKVLALSAGDEYLDELSIKALEIIE